MRPPWLLWVVAEYGSCAVALSALLTDSSASSFPEAAAFAAGQPASGTGTGVLRVRRPLCSSQSLSLLIPGSGPLAHSLAVSLGDRHQDLPQNVSRRNAM